jgi:hypothetical protein
MPGQSAHLQAHVAAAHEEAAQQGKGHERPAVAPHLLAKAGQRAACVLQLRANDARHGANEDVGHAVVHQHVARLPAAWCGGVVCRVVSVRATSMQASGTVRHLWQGNRDTPARYAATTSGARASSVILDRGVGPPALDEAVLPEGGPHAQQDERAEEEHERKTRVVNIERDHYLCVLGGESAGGAARRQRLGGTDGSAAGRQLAQRAAERPACRHVVRRSSCAWSGGERSHAAPAMPVGAQLGHLRDANSRFGKV